MKTFVTVAILVVLVAGVTFVTQFISVKKEVGKDLGTRPDGEAVGLVLPKTGAETLYSEMTPTAGHVDYFFTNPTKTELEVGLEMKSCKCAGVEMRNLNIAEKETYLRSTPASAVAQTFAAPPSSLSCLTAGAAVRSHLQGILGQSGEWVTLTDREPRLTVPAEGVGLLRLRYEGKQDGAQRLKVIVWSKPTGRLTTPSYATVEQPMFYVTPVNVQPREAPVKELTAGGKESIGFLAFSATRSDYTLQAHAENDDPCVEVKCEPLTGDQAVKYLSDTDDKFPVLGSYLIKVTVHENRNGRQLDFGPFKRRIVVTSDVLPEPTYVVVTGNVASDLHLVGEKQNRVNFEQFDASERLRKVVPIESDRPGLKLAVESRTPEILDVQLGQPEPTPAGGQQWKLKIEVPPNRVHGKLPPDSEIVLKTLDTPPRRFRIPVVGQATVK